MVQIQCSNKWSREVNSSNAQENSSVFSSALNVPRVRAHLTTSKSCFYLCASQQLKAASSCLAITWGSTSWLLPKHLRALQGLYCVRRSAIYSDPILLTPGSTANIVSARHGSKPHSTWPGQYKGNLQQHKHFKDVQYFSRERTIHVFWKSFLRHFVGDIQSYPGFMYCSLYWSNVISSILTFICSLNIAYTWRGGTCTQRRCAKCGRLAHAG